MLPEIVTAGGGWQRLDEEEEKEGGGPGEGVPATAATFATTTSGGGVSATAVPNGTTVWSVVSSMMAARIARSARMLAEMDWLPIAANTP